MKDKNDFDLMRKKAAEKLGVHESRLNYYSWPQAFGSTAGPFGGVGGAAMTTFTIEAWEFSGRAALFCTGKLLRVVDDFIFNVNVRC